MDKKHFIEWEQFCEALPRPFADNYSEIHILRFLAVMAESVAVLYFEGLPRSLGFSQLAFSWVANAAGAQASLRVGHQRWAAVQQVVDSREEVPAALSVL